MGGVSNSSTRRKNSFEFITVPVMSHIITYPAFTRPSSAPPRTRRRGLRCEHEARCGSLDGTAGGTVMDEWFSEPEPNVIESSTEGFTVKVLGRTGMRYTEGNRSV